MSWNPIKGEHCLLIAPAVRWDRDPQPGVAHVELTDRHGTVHPALEKTAMFDNYAELELGEGYPREAHIHCTITEINGHHVTVEADIICNGDWPFTLDVDLDMLRRFTARDDN
ncbi:hypothetical protein [Allokutzneria multivorans]